jgi:hypothetical protein
MEVPMKRLLLGLLSLFIFLVATPQVLPKGGYVIKRWTITFYCDGLRWAEDFEGTRKEAEAHASMEIKHCEEGFYSINQ